MGVEAYAWTVLGAGGRSGMTDPAAGAEEARSAGVPMDGTPVSTVTPMGNTADEPVLPPASGGPLYVLVLGVDRRPSEAGGAPSRSDTMMLAQVSPGSGRV